MSEESQVENCNGFRFCLDCGKLCIPLYAGEEPNIMIFKCESCKERRCFINTKVQNDHVIKKAQVLHSEAADIKHRSLGEDPSMPRRQMFCRHCQEDRQIVYYYKASQEEKNILIQFICPLCGLSFTSDEVQKWKKDGTERDFKPLGEGDIDDNREGDHGDDEDHDNLFRNDEEFEEQENEDYRAGREKVEQKEDSFDIFGDDEQISIQID